MTNETYFDWNRADDKTMYIDAVENAVDSLETTISYFQRDDNLKWKWIVFSLHHALYMFCTINLEGGNFQQVLTNGSGYNDDENSYFKKGNDEWKKSRRIRRENSHGYKIVWEAVNGEPRFDNKAMQRKRKDKLIGFWTALARVQDKEFWMARYIHSKAIILNEAQWESVEWLTENVRNQLTHFVPMGLSIPIISLDKACFDVICIIEQLAFDTRQVLYVDSGIKTRIKNSIKILKDLLADR
ncbi:MAG: hypothetical protein IT281_02835 [Ignavibacteria bacterium]|nr:hypothetical protein [Ignavibacteria bacterium]